jgi:hypothetical protein
MKAIHAVCAVLAAFCAALAGLGPVAAGTGVAAAPRSGGVPIVRIAGGSVRGAAVPTGYEFLGLPYAAPRLGTCAGVPPSLRPGGTAFATRRSSRRAARSRRARSRLPPPSRRTACISTSTRRRFGATLTGRCWCGSTAVGSPRMAPGTTTAPSSRRTAPSWSRSTTVSARSGSWPIQR